MTVNNNYYRLVKEDDYSNGEFKIYFDLNPRYNDGELSISFGYNDGELSISFEDNVHLFDVNYTKEETRELYLAMKEYYENL